LLWHRVPRPSEPWSPRILFHELYDEHDSSVEGRPLTPASGMKLTMEINSLTRRLNPFGKADLRLKSNSFSLLRLGERMRGSTPRG
jgi:hypothetical protein